MINNEKRGRIVSVPICEDPINNMLSIRVSRSIREDDAKTVYADIREFKLIPINGNYDGKLKATSKGIHFIIDKIPVIVKGLLKLYKDEMGIKLTEEDLYKNE